MKAFRSCRAKTRKQRKSYMNIPQKISGDLTFQGRGAPVPHIPDTKAEAVPQTQREGSTMHLSHFFFFF